MRLIRTFSIAAALLVAQLSAFAAGSVSQSITQLGTTDVYVVTFYWIGDAGTGSVPTTVAQGMQGLSGYQFIGAEFSPGTPAPTAGYTVKINSGVGVDLLGGNGATLSATVPSSAAPSDSATPIVGAVSLAISGNTAAGAQGRVLAYFQKPGVASPIRISGGGGVGTGTVTNVTLSGTGFEISVAGTCTITTTGVCVLSIPSDFRIPGTINKINLTQPATGAVLTIEDGYTLTVNGNATVSGTNTGDQTLYNQTIQDENFPLTQRSVLNFAGTGVTCVDATTKTTCTINSGTTIAATSLVLKGDGAGNGVAATVGTDYVVPAGNVATATALAANPVDCTVANTFANVIAASGNLSCDYERLPANAQTGTSYTILNTDLSKFITFNNAASVAVVAPQATGSFSDGFWFIAKNIGAGTVTITPTTSTISGTSSITLETGEFAIVRSDGVNYEAASNRIIQGTNITLTKARVGPTVASGGGSVFTGSTATNPSFSASPTFSLADVSVKSPVRIEPGAMTANVTAVTFSNKSAGAKFSIAWTQDGTGGRTVSYGASATNACQVSSTAGSTTTQFFEVGSDGTTVYGTGCIGTDNTLSGPEQAAPGTPASGAFVCWADSTTHVFSCKDNGASTVSNQVVAKDCNALSAGDVVKSISSAGIVGCITPSGGSGPYLTAYASKTACSGALNFLNYYNDSEYPNGVCIAGTYYEQLPLYGLAAVSFPSFTGVNSPTVSTTAGGIKITGTAGTLQLDKETIGATFTRTAVETFVFNLSNGGGGNGVSLIGVTDGTKCLVLQAYPNGFGANLRVTYSANCTGFDSADSSLSGAGALIGAPIKVSVTVDATNITFTVNSRTQGQTFYQQALSTHSFGTITGAVWGTGYSGTGTTQTYITLLDWR